jgi:hypothetical protein
MPKTMNIKKAASALNQNQKQIKAALAGVHVTFAAVEKSLGRAQFLLKLSTSNGIKTATGAPRGLFSAGTMRISVGQIVIVEGSEKLGFEIVARIDDLSDAQKLVKLGALPADLLAVAQVAGSKSGVAAEADEDDLFDRSEVTEAGAFEPSLKGGVKGARKQQESLAAAAALASRLGSSFASFSGAAAPRLESAMDLSAFVGCDEKAVKKVKKSFVGGSGSSAARALAAAPVKEAKSEEVVIDFALWHNSSNDEASFKPVVLAPAPFSWEDDDAVAIDIDAI